MKCITITNKAIVLVVIDQMFVTIVNNLYLPECQLYDSLSNGKVPPDVAKQIAAFFFCDLPEILVEIKGV